MSNEYKLTLAGDLPAQHLIDLALPGHAAETSAEGTLRSLDLTDGLGLIVRATAGAPPLVVAGSRSTRLAERLTRDVDGSRLSLMSVNYTLFVHEDLAPERDLELAHLTGEEAGPGGRGLLSATHPARGFVASTYLDDDVYVQLMWPETPAGIPHNGPGSPGAWTPSQAVALSFLMSDDSPEDATADMIHAVARVLAGTSGDAALESDAYLLLTRFDGVVRHHHTKEFWSFYGPHDAASDQAGPPGREL